MENKPVTIREVAKKAGVSVSTVSRAFNNYSDISDATREAIIKVADEIGYKQVPITKSEGPKRNFRLGMLIEDYETQSAFNPMVFETLMAFKNTAARMNYEMVLLSTTSDNQKSDQLSNLFIEKQLDGIFIMGLRLNDEYYKQLKSINYPCILFDLYIENPLVSCIGTDNVKGAFMAVEHLIKLGHKKIAFINGHKEAFVSYERMDGYYLAMQRYNLPIDNELIKYGDYSDQSAEKAAEELVKSQKGFTAIFCASDLMAIGAINMLGNLGYEVPNDVSVVGFDDMYIAQYITPKLTTIRQNRLKIGETAANVLVSLIEGKAISRVLIQPELIVRESTKEI